LLSFIAKNNAIFPCCVSDSKSGLSGDIIGLIVVLVVVVVVCLILVACLKYRYGLLLAHSVKLTIKSISVWSLLSLFYFMMTSPSKHSSNFYCLMQRIMAVWPVKTNANSPKIALKPV